MIRACVAGRWRQRLLATTLAMLSTVATARPAASTEPLLAITAAAEDAVRQHYTTADSRVVVSPGALNPRLALQACPLPLRATVPPRAAPASRVSVPVECPEAGGWLIRVPLSLQVFRNVLVTSHALQRGDGLLATDLHDEPRDVALLGYGAIDDFAQVDGRALARALPTGHVLTPNDLGGRRMVLAGDHVQVVARLDGIQVSTQGIALGGGDNGARLRVRNSGSGRIIDAVVIAPGRVDALP